MTVVVLSCSLAAASIGGMSLVQIVLLTGVILSVLWAVLSSFRKMNRTGQMPRPSLRELKAVSEKTRNAARDLEELMTELDQLAHQLHGRLDARIEKLESLLKLSDERIDRIERLQRSVNNEPAIDVTLSAENTGPADTADGLDQRHAAIYRLADGGLSPLEIADEVNKPAGEVELILALRKARTSAADRLQPVSLT